MSTQMNSRLVETVTKGPIKVLRNYIEQIMNLDWEDFTDLIFALERTRSRFERLNYVLNARVNFNDYTGVVAKLIIEDAPLCDEHGGEYWPMTVFLFEVLDLGWDSILQNVPKTSRTDIQARFERIGIITRTQTRRIIKSIPVADVPLWLIDPLDSCHVRSMRNMARLTSLKPFNDSTFKDSDLLDEAIELESEDRNVRDANSLTDKLLPVLKFNQRLKGSVGTVELDRLYGPLHASPGFDCPGSVGDSHRMLRCNCFETETSEDEVSSQKYHWFTHVCESCKFRILKPQHAVRIPLTGGGFRGTFCSTDCARRSPVTAFDSIMEFNFQALTDTLEAHGIYR